MTRNRTSWLMFLPLIAFGCGSSAKNNNGLFTGDGGSTEEGGAVGDDEGGTTTGEGGSATGANSAPLIVDQGPKGAGGSVDVPFVSVTLCIPGTTTCQTIDHVTVDTGSSGLRVLASVLSSDMKLPQVNATTGDALAECFQFDDGYTWGSVRQADVKIAGEVASKIPLELIGDPAFATVPAGCSSSGTSEDTLRTFGANGLIGINQIIPDCGTFCAGSPAQEGAYYSCSGSTCTAVAVATSAQIANPIAAFPKDNNGAILQFPAVPAGGAATVAGTLIFGIGTASNNGLGSAQVLTVDSEGNFTTLFDGQTLNTSFIDSGTNTLSFNDTSITQCTSAETSGFFCPTTPVSLSAQNKGLNGVTSTVSFTVESADTLFAESSFSVFDDLATPGVDNTSFDWGFPFFLGRNVFVALDGKTTPGGKGPYFAY